MGRADAVLLLLLALAPVLLLLMLAPVELELAPKMDGSVGLPRPRRAGLERVEDDAAAEAVAALLLLLLPVELCCTELTEAVAVSLESSGGSSGCSSEDCC